MALLQLGNAPSGGAVHHEDAGLNVLLHEVGPMLLLLAPLLAALVHLVRARWRLLGRDSALLFAVPVALEASGVLVSAAHHSIVFTAVIALVGIVGCLVSALVTASIAALVARGRRQRWPRERRGLGAIERRRDARLPQVVIGTQRRRGPPAPLRAA